MIVYGRASSSNVQAVMWGCTELGLKVERRDVGGPFGGLDTPAFRAMNPMGKVPVLEDGEVVMFESPAILRYLVARHGEGIFDRSPQADTWAEWAKTSLSRAFIEPVFWAYYRTPEAERDMEQVMIALRQFESLLALAMRQRGDAQWMMGEQISLADIWVGHGLYRYFTLDLPRQLPKGAQDYYQMLTSHMAYQSHVMIDYSELKGRLSF